MSLLDLAVLYALVGLACAVAIFKSLSSAPSAGPGRSDDRSRLRALASAALALPLWPLWAPIALARVPAPPAPPGRAGFAGAPGAAAARTPAARPVDRAAAGGSAARDAGEPAAEIAARIEAALAECVDACAGTPVEALLPAEAAGRISAEVARAAARHAELHALLRREDLDRAVAERRLAALEAERASPRTLATARLHLDNVRRLAALRDRDARALGDLEDLVQALRTQLLLARYAGPGLGDAAAPKAGAAIAGTSGIVAEVWARVESLSAVLETQEPHEALDLDPPRPEPAPIPAP